MGALVEVYGRSDIGRTRESNQDYIVAGNLHESQRCDFALTGPVQLPMAPQGPLLLVCDGMGGADGGDIAARVAANVVWAEMSSAIAEELAHTTFDSARLARILRRAVRLANRRVFEVASKRPELKGMGTTISACALTADTAIIAQVGDSRAYVYRNHSLTQVTRDQSVVSALLHAGHLSLEEARRSPASNVILQALGVSLDVDVSLSLIPLRRGDWILLCSDGLHGELSDGDISDTIDEATDPRGAVEQLISRALAAGGNDNVSVVVAQAHGEAMQRPHSVDDLPRFLEFDPQEEGPRAIATTSRVARRLAARAGLGVDPGPIPFPATGQHAIYRGTIPEQEPATEDAAPIGPAERHLRDSSRIRPLTWITIALMVLVACAALAWWIHSS